MEDTYKPVAFPRMVERWDYLLSVLLLTVLGGAAICSFLLKGKPGDIVLSVLTGLIVLGVDVWLLLRVLPTVTVSAYGITLSIGKLVLKRVRTKDIQTVAKVYIRGRNPIVILCITPTSDTVIEEKGKEKLKKKPLVKESIKFRENKSDWPDVCLGEGLQMIGKLWIEFTPERQQLLQKVFPNAAHREAKRYCDPPRFT